MADNLIDICEAIVLKIWEPRRLFTQWASASCYKDIFTLPYTTELFLPRKYVLIA
jgi:hypothetical protein